MNNFETLELQVQEISLEEMTLINGGYSPAYDVGYEAGVGAKKALQVIGIFLLFWGS